MAGLCVPGNEGDGTGPQLVGNLDIVPAIAGVGQEVEIRFRLSESLIGPPLVFLMLEDVQKPFALDTQAMGQDSPWTFRYVVDGSEPQGQVPIGISMVGSDGDAVSGLFIGNLDLDFRAPRVSDVEIFPIKASIQQTIEVSFLLDENVPSQDVHVWMQNEDSTADAISFNLLERAESEPGTQWKFDYTPHGQEPNGRYEIWFESQDAAGNQRTVRHDVPVILDFVAPNVLVPSQVAELPPISVDDELRIEIVLDETADPTPVVRARSVLSPIHEIAFEALQGNGESLRYAGRFNAGMPEGFYEIFLTGLQDEVGNESEDSLLYRVLLDNTPPSLNLFSPSEISVQADATLEATFISSEPLGAPPRLQVGGFDMARDLAVAEPAYRFTLEIADTSLSGSHFIEAVLEDRARNAVVLRPGLVHVDQTAPNLIDAFFSPTFARRGSLVLFSLYVDEEVGRDPSSTVPRIDFIWRAEKSLPLEYVSSSGLNHTYRAWVNESIADGEYTLEALEMTDEAGNRSIRSIAETVGESPCVVVDTTPPVVDDIALNAFFRSAVEGHRDVVLTFRTDEDLRTDTVQTDAAHIRVTAEGTDIPCEHTGALAYRCVMQIDETMSAGPKWIRIQAQDEAGNVTLESASFEVDHTAPGLIDDSLSLEKIGSDALLVPSVSRVQQSTRVRVAFMSSEELGAGSYVDAMHPNEHIVLSFEKIGQTGNIHIFEYLCVPGVPDGEYLVKLTLIDVVGNQIEDLDTGLTFTIDNTPPIPISARLHRYPWGVPDNAAPMSISFDAATVHEPITLIAYDDLSSSGIELGRGNFANGTGTARLNLSPVNTDRVSLVAVDEAGNETRMGVVRDVEWVARFTHQQTNPVTQPHFAAATSIGSQSLTFSIDTEAEYSRALSFELASADGAVDTMMAFPNLSLRAGGKMLPQAYEMLWNIPQAKDAESGRSSFDRRRGEIVFWNRDPGVSHHWTWRSDHWVETAHTDPESDGNPGDFDSVELAYDAQRGRTVLIGFVDGENQVWESDGTSWKRVLGKESPFARKDFTLLSRGNDVVMFGGNPYEMFLLPRPLNDLWAWNGSSWNKLPLSDGGPDTLQAPTGVFDEKRDTVIIAGNDCESWEPCDAPNHIWEWNSADGWQLVNESLGSTGTYSIASVWDPVRERSIFAIWQPNQMLPELIAWNGEDATPLHLVAPKLAYLDIGASTVCYNVNDCAGTEAGSLEYDENTDSLVLFARHRRAEGLNALPLEHTVWQLEPAADGADSYIAKPLSPASMYAEEALYNPLLGDTLPAPAQIYDHAMVYDPVAQRTLLFGGEYVSDFFSTTSQDFWAWDGVRWGPAECSSLYEPEGCVASARPTAQTASAMAYDSLRNITWVFTAPATRVVQGTNKRVFYAPAIWQWDGVNRLWSAIRTCTGDFFDWQCEPMSGVGPKAFEAHHVVYDSTRDRLVMFIEDKDEIWELNPNTLSWEMYSWYPDLVMDLRLPRQVGVVYDPQRQCTVAVGVVVGADFGDSTTASCWHPSTGWTPIGPAPLSSQPPLPPPSVRNPRLVYEPKGGSIFRFGGDDPQEITSDMVYELTPTEEWKHVRPPQLRGFHRWNDLRSPNGVYDSVRNRLVVHGFSPGSDVPRYSNLETWELDFAPTLPPAHTLRIDLSDLYRSTDLSGEAISIEGLSVRAQSGATGHGPEASALVDGASIDFWNGFRFVQMGENDAPIDAGEEVIATLAGSANVEPFIQQREFHLRIRPKGTNSQPTSPAGVSTDFAEVRVDYKLPP